MSSFLLKDIRIFDGEQTIENGSVLVEHGKITKVVSGSDIPFDGPVFSRPGHTLIPGLIDVHVHVDKGNDIALPQSLRFGVTTACDLHNEYVNIEKLRRQVEGGDCADLKTTSFAATVDGGWPMQVVLSLHDDEETRAEVATWPKLVTPEDGRKYVQDRVRENVNYIKLMHESGTFIKRPLNKPSLDLQKAIIDEAHKHGLITIAHSTCLADTLEILEAGIDGLAHTFLDQPPTDALIAAYQKNNAHCNPTLVALGSLTTQGKERQERFAHDPRVQHLLAEGQRESVCACMAFAKDLEVENGYESVRQLKKAGIDILCGSDSAGPALGTSWGLSLHQELSIFVSECGFTPEEALKSATSLSAKRFHFADRGRIREGLRADLVLVEGNPLEDIDRTLDLRGVWTAGKICSTYKDGFKDL